MNFGTDDTEGIIAAGNLLPSTIPVTAAADAANTGFCIDYQEK